MKKILITGGTGTIGSALIERWPHAICMGHSEKRMREFLDKHAYKKNEYYICPIEDREAVFSIFEKVRPDIVVHCAALKHIDFAATHPTRACRVNVQGSLNILSACRLYAVPVAVAVSTDKAAAPCSTYGYTKALMEQCFVEAGYAACRFGNVAGSAGSVIPYWKEQAAKGNTIKVTDLRMNRFMFSLDEAVQLVHETVRLCSQGERKFILVRKMLVVNIGQLAECISHDVEIVGARPGEQQEECLVTKEEIRYVAAEEGPYYKIGRNLEDYYTTAYDTITAPKMSYAELKALIA